MRAYELMVIFDGDLDEPAAQAWVKTITDQIAARGGKVHGKADWWGKRRFAYEIKHKAEGYYVVLQARAEPQAMEELARTLSLADEVIRHMVLRIPEKVYGPPKAAGASAGSRHRE